MLALFILCGIESEMLYSIKIFWQNFFHGVLLSSNNRKHLVTMDTFLVLVRTVTLPILSFICQAVHLLKMSLGILNVSCLLCILVI